MRRTFKVVRNVALVLVVLIAALVLYANVRIARDEVVSAEVGAPGRFLTLRGYQWHVVTHGNVTAQGEAPILLIHGFAAVGQHMWKRVLGPLGARRSLILPDILGYGHSQHVVEPGPHYTLGNYSASLLQMLDALGVEQVDVIGHSYGGAIAARFALEHPERVRRIVFIDAAVYYTPSMTDHIVQLPLGIGRAVAWSVAGAGPASGMVRICRAQKSEDCARTLHIKDTTDTTRAMMYSHHHSPDYAALADDLPKIKTPSFVLWGDNDPFFPPAHGERLARALGAPLELVPGGLHAPHLYYPEKVSARILEFLDR